MDISQLLETIKTLRHPETGCPWDREQKLADLLKPLSSEVDELTEAIFSGDSDHIREELGDVFFNVCQILVVAQEDGLFEPEHSIDEVIEKMVRRHPHVFGEDKAKDAEHAAKLYQQAKRQEK